MTKKTVKENIDQNKFQPINTNNEYEALQGNNIARNEAMLNGEAQIKHHLSKYTDDKKRWLGTKADEEQSIYLFFFFFCNLFKVDLYNLWKITRKNVNIQIKIA